MNAANDRLEHMAGVAGAISRAAGPSLQEESRLLVAQYGPVKEGTATWTSAGATCAIHPCHPFLPCHHMLLLPGRLPFQGVIHAVGPMWSGGYRGEDELLRGAVTSVLELASNFGVRLRSDNTIR